ncbi:MAG: HEPN domain-containing protein [Gemmataceae bacterium]|nr:HEPN domain-containing protein [Gemmataceae bacterium]
MRKRFPPDDPREWLNRAKSNLALAGNTIPSVDFEDLCFDAQQCAEKAIKAIFIGRGETFPFIHDLEKLLGILEENGLKIPKYIWEAEELSQYAAKTRYPGMADPVTPREYRRAVRIATAVLRWAERQVERT